MNYNRPIIITLLALLSLCSVLARANEDFKIFTDNINDRINKIQADIDKRGVTTTTQRQAGGATVTVAKNYPVVPYDPNHPNVQKQKKTSFNIKANAKTLAGRFARGLNGVALGYAVVDLLGDGIDWALDPENNRVIVTNTNTDYDTTLEYQSRLFSNQTDWHSSPHEACNHTFNLLKEYNSQRNWQNLGYKDGNCHYEDSYYLQVVTRKKQNQDDTTLSLDTIANHVINNEDNSTTNVITNNYYNTVNETIIEQIEKGEHDNDIATAVRNVSQPDDSTSPNDKTDNKEQPQEQPGDESKPFELPEFCDWATKVCEFIDWVKQEPPEPPPPKQVPKANLSDLGLDEKELFKQRVQFDGQCPKHELKFAINGKQIIEPIPTYHFCNLLEQIAPWLLAFSYLSAGFFVIRNL